MVTPILVGRSWRCNE